MQSCELGVGGVPGAEVHVQGAVDGRDPIDREPTTQPPHTNETCCGRDQTKDLIMRSIAKRCVSKDGTCPCLGPSFETAAQERSLLGVRSVVYRRQTRHIYTKSPPSSPAQCQRRCQRQPRAHFL